MYNLLYGEERNEFICRRFGSIENFRSVAFGYLSLMYDKVSELESESEDFSTNEYVPGIVEAVFEDEEGHLVMKVIVDDKLRHLHLSHYAAETIRGVKNYILNHDFDWEEEEIEQNEFMDNRIIMFKANDNTVSDFYAISSDDLNYMFEYIHTLEELCCKC